MTVCKCDRCGKYVDKSTLPRIHGEISPVRKTPSDKDICMDLCPECYSLLREFLGYHDYKHEEEEYDETELTFDKRKNNMKTHYESFNELYQDIKEHLVKEGYLTPKTFEGPDYSKEDTNEYKDLYLIKHYRVPNRQSLEVYSLGDLGRIPADSKWGNIEQLRELYSDYKTAVERHPIGPFEDAGFYNNYFWYVVSARSVMDAIAVYQIVLWRDKEETLAFADNDTMQPAT